jgi:nucleoside-diphosphate-sugar epimerase
VHLSLPFDDPKDREPNISKDAAELDWCPFISLHEGIISTDQDITTQLSG